MGTSALEFEKPIAELEKQIDELRRVAEERKLDVVPEIAPLQEKLHELRRDVYRNLTPIQRVQVARSARRPFTLDYLRLAFTDFIELNGDRAFRNDPSIVGGGARHWSGLCPALDLVLGPQKNSAGGMGGPWSDFSHWVGYRGLLGGLW